MIALHLDMAMCVSVLKYYAGWSDKIHGKTIEVSVHIWCPLFL